MTFQIRQLSTADYPFVISVIDQWRGGRQMADKLPRLFFEHFADTSFAAERDGKLAGFPGRVHLPVQDWRAYIHFLSAWIRQSAATGSGAGQEAARVTVSYGNGRDPDNRFQPDRIP